MDEQPQPTTPGHDLIATNGHTPRRPEDSALTAAPPAESPAEQALPRYSTRGAAPGPRGCWALNREGDPCGSARRADSDYCNAHSGYGVAANPKAWSAVGIAKNTEIRRRRATLRTTLGITRTNSPRGLLKALVFAESERVAAAALDGALAAELPVDRRAAHAVRLIEMVEPQVQATLSVALPDNPEGVEQLSLSQLLSIAQEEGIRLPDSG